MPIMQSLFLSQNTRNIKSKKHGLAWERREIHIGLVGKPRGRIPFTRTRRRWKDKIKMDLKGTAWEGVDWSHNA
jgi:hypothetical protein